MSDPIPEKESIQTWHKTFAMEANHLVWNLLSKANRSREEDEQMIHAAHASRFHWGEVGTPVHRTRGDWLLSHVYAVLHRPQPALDYARVPALRFVSSTRSEILIWPMPMKQWRGRTPLWARRTTVSRTYTWPSRQENRFRTLNQRTRRSSLPIFRVVPGMA